jgi:hypothetical protein
MSRFAACASLALALLAALLAFAAPAGGRADDTPESLYEFEIERGWLRMPDGVRLSVTYFKPLPKTADEHFPVLLELLPYRKDDLFYIRDYPLHSYFARRGYVSAKVDIRGTGSSEGAVPPREYSEAELADAVEIIRQLAAAPWSTGKVGMWGVSWGGFNALQVAMRRPPALKAILALHASDDLYHDDIHFIDGIFHVDEYEMGIDHTLAFPRSPDYPLDDAYFEQRFGAYPWFLTYLKQQQDGPFWRNHSLRWQYEKINIPVYAIGGLLDGYRSTVPRLLEHLRGRVRAEIGPWNHSWPDTGIPGPNYEWRREAVRWWDHWLKGRDTGILSEPRFAVFVREGHPPDANLKMSPGHWRYEDWPLQRTRWTPLFPATHHRLTATPGEAVVESLQTSPGAGFEAGLWWGEPTGDLRPLAGTNFFYDSEPLDSPLEIIGFPRVRLRVAADAPLAHWIVRLEDVLPDGRVSLVTGGALNGAQRRSRLQPLALEPGKAEVIELELHFTTWTFQPGHRIRLAVANAQFPMFWPAPYPTTTRLFVGDADTQLLLPLIRPGERRTPPFLPPEPREQRPDARHPSKGGWPLETHIERDLTAGTTTMKWRGEADYELPGSRLRETQQLLYRARDADPADALFEGQAETSAELPGRRIVLRTWAEIRSDKENFYVRFTRRLFENEALVRERTWEETVPRNFQ